MQNLGDIFKSKAARSTELVEKLRAKTTGVAVQSFQNCRMAASAKFSAGKTTRPRKLKWWNYGGKIEK